MLTPQKVQAIKNSPEFIALTKSRNRFAWTLSIVMLAVYYGFIMILAFTPELFGIPLGGETVITVGIPVGVGIILLAFVLTGLYVRRANGEFDELTQKIKEDARIEA